MIVKSADQLSDLVEKIFVAAGADDGNAKVVADHLVLASLSGVDTHGVLKVPGYIENIRKGEIVPAAKPEVLSEGPTRVLVKGNWTFGHVAAAFAMRAGIAKARESGVAIVGIVEAHHMGRVGHFTELAASEGMISMVWMGGQGEDNGFAVPHGGRERASGLHTNPISLGFPAGDGWPMMFDYATTQVAGTKVLLARDRGEALPPGCIVDKVGNPSTDPNDFFTGGGMLPFGGHKGYAMMMATEFLGRIFTRADAFSDSDHGGVVFRHQGVSMIVIRADLFQSFEAYEGRAEEMRQRVRSVAPAPGFDEVLAPGDLEGRTRVTRQRDGIPLRDDVWEKIAETAASLGVAVD